jgi:hypothetical protein
MKKSVLSCSLLVAAATAWAGPASANTCTWWDPYDGHTYQNAITPNPNVGPGLQGAQVVLVFVGQTFYGNANVQGSLPQLIIDDYSAELGDPSFWTRFSQYGVTSGSFWGPAYLDRSLSNTSISDQDIRTMIETGVTFGNLPGSGNYVYMVYVPSDIQSPAGGGSGYHKMDPLGYPYGVYEYSQGALANNDFIATSAHEIMEMITDPSGEGSAAGWWAQSPPGAANGNNSQLEIGDLCNGMNFPVATNIWGQSTWLQDQCRCERAQTVGIFRPGSSPQVQAQCIRPGFQASRGVPAA